MIAFFPLCVSGEAVVAGVTEDIKPGDFPYSDELVKRIDLPPRRAREAIARYVRGPLNSGMRLRVTFDITFPEITRDDGPELLARLGDAIARNTAARCKDVRYRTSESIASVARCDVFFRINSDV